MTAPNRFRVLTAFTAVIATIIVLHRLGAGPLALPHRWSPTAVADWAQDRDPVTIALVVFRLLALAVAYHLAVTTAIGLAGRIMHLPAWVAAADAWTLPPLRSTWGRLAGLGLTATAALTSQLPAATASPRPTATIQIMETRSGNEPGDDATLRTTEPSPSTGTATLRPADGSADPTASDPPRRDARPDERSTATGQPTSQVAIHIVQAGDHLWAIAEAHLTDHLGRAPADAEVAPYWQRVIAANPQVADPDLIYPGQSIEIPPLLDS